MSIHLKTGDSGTYEAPLWMALLVLDEFDNDEMMLSFVLVSFRIYLRFGYIQWNAFFLPESNASLWILIQ
jgi:hypothetical protein